MIILLLFFRKIVLKIVKKVQPNKSTKKITPKSHSKLGEPVEKTANKVKTPEKIVENGDSTESEATDEGEPDESIESSYPE